MKIEEIKGKHSISETFKIIFVMNAKEKWGKQMQTLVVADIDSKEGDKTALLDLVGDDIGKYDVGNKIKVIDCWSKIMENQRYGAQPLISQGNGGKYQKVEE